MKLKKITTFSLAMALCLSSLAVGCGKELTPKEKLIAATEKNTKIESIDANYNMTLNTPDSEFAKVSGSMVFSDFMKEGKMTQNLSLNGMGIEQTTFMKDGKTYTTIPMMNKFLETENSPAFDIKSPQMVELQKQFVEKFKEVLADVDVTETKEDDLTKLDYSLTDEQTSSYIKDSIDTIFTEEIEQSIKDEMQEQVKSQVEAADTGLSEEELNQTVKQQTDMSFELVKSMLTESTFSNFSSTYYVNEKNDVKKVDMTISIDLADDIKTMLSALQLDIPVLTVNITVDYNSINEKVNVDYSQLTEENVMTIEEYAQQLSGMVETPAA